MRRFAIYLLVQLLAYALDVSVFWGIFSLTDRPLFSNLISKICAGSCAFLLHRAYTFSSKGEGTLMVQAIKYFAVLTIYIPISSGLLLLLLHAMPTLPAKIAADVILVGASFLISRFLIFK